MNSSLKLSVQSLVVRSDNWQRQK